MMLRDTNSEQNNLPTLILGKEMWNILYYKGAILVKKVGKHIVVNI